MLLEFLSKLILDSPPVKMIPSTTIETKKKEPALKTCHLLSLPNELLYVILSSLTWSDVGRLCLTGSSVLQSRILSWISSSACSKFVIESVSRELNLQSGYEKWITECRKFGMLCKKVSMLYGTSKRLQLLSLWFSIFKDEASKILCGNQTWVNLLIRLGMAAALSSFIKGWDEGEYPRVFAWVLNHEVTQELDERNIFKMFFWEFMDNDEMKSSWLIYRLNTKYLLGSKFNSRKTLAEKFFEFLGPHDPYASFRAINSNSDRNDFNAYQSRLYTKFMGKVALEILQEVEPSSYGEAKVLFSDFGKGLRVLLQSPSVPNSMIVSILNLMFIEKNFLMDNQAACLLFSCEAIVKLYLSKLLEQDTGYHSSSCMLAALVIVCGRLSNDIDNGLSNILTWSFQYEDVTKRCRIIEQFWKELVDRIEDGDVEEDSLIQVGAFVGKHGYCLSNSNVKSTGKRKHLQSEE